MVQLIYDGSFQGLFTAIFYVYEHKLNDVCLYQTGKEPPLLFGDKITVHSDEEKSKRVWKKLYQLVGKEGMLTLRRVYLSELADMEQVILNCVRYAIRQNKNIMADYGDADVLRLKQMDRMVGREKHRMEAFVRFQLTRDQIFYSVIEPDFNILPLIMPHFESRYADQRWLIYDKKRKYGIYYDLHTTEFIELEPVHDLTKPNNLILQENEPLYQTLWTEYFHSTNIQSRKNMKLHLQHVPRRYWKYLTEKQPLRKPSK